jgi:hypothetical protein
MNQHARDCRRVILTATAWLDRAVKAAREIGDRVNEGAALGNLGRAYADGGETKRATAYHEQNLVVAREIGDRRGEGIAARQSRRCLCRPRQSPPRDRRR